MKTERIIVLTAEQATKAALQKQRIPKHLQAVGYGAHKSVKDYDRKRLNRELRKELFD